jgi:hypothetical protein
MSSNGNGHDIHRFRETDIIDFVQRHPLEISLGKVEQIWFLDMVLLKGAELQANHFQSQASHEDDVA